MYTYMYVTFWFPHVVIVVQSSTSSLPLKIASQASCSFRHYFEGPEEEL